MFRVCSFIGKAATCGPDLLSQQTRNTFILKRRWPPPLHKKGGKVPKMKGRHFVYDLVEDSNIRKATDMKIILSQFVDGIGKTGDIITLHPNKAYNDFLLPGLAVYATPENLKMYKVDESKPSVEDTYSSPYVHRTITSLSRLVLQITMNKIHPWTLEPWHIKASFRKTGFIVPEEAIQMPSVHIKGPDLNIQDKEFYVTVTINKREKVNVRCRIHHWATGLDRLPWEEYHWKKPLQALISEQSPILEKMPLPE